jgi:putative transposase
MNLVHALNRGVESRNLFLDDQDYFRFIHNLYEFNDSAPADHNLNAHLESRGFVNPYVERKRERLVDLHAWCLMKNHYHLLLSERVEGGLSLFLRKINVGYANYFNEKYQRSGTLFQGRTKKVPIERAAHFLHILHYIHLNPLDYFKGNEGWRLRDKGGIRNVKAALSYLDSYRWSSYMDYVGAKNFPSLITTSLFKNKDVFQDYRKSTREYLEEIDLDDIQKITLE